MYLYDIFACGDDYYGDSYCLYHEQYFTHGEFIEHIKQCVPELVEFVKFELPIINWEKQKQFQKESLDDISNWDDKQKEHLKQLTIPGDTIEEKYQNFIQIHTKRLEKIEKTIPQQNKDFEWSAESIDYLIDILCKKFGYSKFDNETHFSVDLYKKINKNTKPFKYNKKDTEDENNRLKAISSLDEIICKNW